MNFPKNHLPKPLGTPEWMFPWKRSDSAFFGTLLAAVVVGGVFAFAFLSVSVRVAVPQSKVPRKASLIYLNDDRDGRALAMLAREGGPFPSRFRPGQWAGMADLEAAVTMLSRIPQSPYEPQLKEFPGQPLVEAPPRWPELGMVFPKSEVIQKAPAGVESVIQVPELFPLSGIFMGDIPKPLPAFSGSVGRANAGIAWRFLLQLDATGRVRECIAMEKGEDSTAVDLQNWLRGIRFSAEDPPASVSGRWICLGVGFTNQSKSLNDESGN